MLVLLKLIFILCLLIIGVRLLFSFFCFSLSFLFLTFFHPFFLKLALFFKLLGRFRSLLHEEKINNSASHNGVTKDTSSPRFCTLWERALIFILSRDLIRETFLTLFVFSNNLTGFSKHANAEMTLLTF